MAEMNGERWGRRPPPMPAAARSSSSWDGSAAPPRRRSTTPSTPSSSRSLRSSASSSSSSSSPRTFSRSTASSSLSSSRSGSGVSCVTLVLAIPRATGGSGGGGRPIGGGDRTAGADVGVGRTGSTPAAGKGSRRGCATNAPDWCPAQPHAERCGAGEGRAKRGLSLPGTAGRADEAPRGRRESRPDAGRLLKRDSEPAMPPRCAASCTDPRAGSWSALGCWFPPWPPLRPATRRDPPRASPVTW